MQCLETGEKLVFYLFEDERVDNFISTFLEPLLTLLDNMSSVSSNGTHKKFVKSE